MEWQTIWDINKNKNKNTASNIYNATNETDGVVDGIA